jgi:hypothetical protein
MTEWTRRPLFGMGYVRVMLAITLRATGRDEYWTNVSSRGRGLLALFLFSDIGPDDVPTRLIVGSHVFMPPILQHYGDAGVGGGVVAGQLRPSVLCRRAAEATGRAGDMILCHPFLVHTATWPHRGTTPRMMAQPGVEVPDGFGLDGSDPSPVARAIVAGLASPGWSQAGDGDSGGAPYPLVGPAWLGCRGLGGGVHRASLGARDLVRRTGSGSPSTRMGFAWWDVRPTLSRTLVKWSRVVDRVVPESQPHDDSLSADIG